MHSKKLATKTQKKRKPLAPERKEWWQFQVELELLTHRDEDRMQVVLVFALKVSCRWFPPTNFCASRRQQHLAALIGRCRSRERPHSMEACVVYRSRCNRTCSIFFSSKYVTTAFVSGYALN